MNNPKYKELAKKYGMSADEIKRIVESQFEFTKGVIQSGDDEQVRLQYLGTYKVKPGRRETVRKRRERTKKHYEERKKAG